MPDFSASAIILRRIAYGDHDLILTFLTREQGKMSAFAKSARRSTRQFSPGLLEPLSVVNMVWATGRGHLPRLQEAQSEQPFPNIRAHVQHAAYASYWAELTGGWLEEGEPQPDLYDLLYDVLEALDRGRLPAGVLSLLFQMKFMGLAGIFPNLTGCAACQTPAERVRGNRLISDPVRGGVVCETCAAALPNLSRSISKGTLRQLLWLGEQAPETASRILFTPHALREGLAFAEAFMAYHLGKTPQSLRVLRQIRRMS